MARAPDKKAEQAKAMYLNGMKLVEIASQLNIPEGTVRSWKNRHKWGCNVADGKRNVAKRKRGAQPGNHNSSGGPPGNRKAEKYGFFSKHLPPETCSIIQEMSKDPLDILWGSIEIQYAAIIRAQSIMYVASREDKTKEVVGMGEGGIQYGIQQAWDKQSNFLQAQSKALSALESLLRRYDELLHKNWALATEEQKVRIEHLRAQKAKIEAEAKQAAAQDAPEERVTIINDARSAD